LGGFVEQGAHLAEKCLPLRRASRQSVDLIH
jgi:hypothetical protein